MPECGLTELSFLFAPCASVNVFKRGPSGHVSRKMRVFGTVFRCLGACWLLAWRLRALLRFWLWSQAEISFEE